MKRPTKREAALASIASLVADAGRIDQYALDVYIRSRIAYPAFMEAARKGMAVYNRRLAAQA